MRGSLRQLVIVGLCAAALLLVEWAVAADVGRSRTDVVAQTPGDCVKGEFLIDESFVTPDDGYVVSDPADAHCRPQLMATVDGGRTFTPRGTLPGNVVDFTSADVDWAYSSGLYRTLDGGLNWQRMHRTGNVIALAARGHDVLAVASRCGPRKCRHTLEISSDDGSHWTARALPGDASSAWDQAQVLVPGNGSDGFVVTGSETFRVSLPAARVQRAADPRACRDPQGTFVGPSLAGTGPGDLWLLCALGPGMGSQGKLLFRSGDGARHWRQLHGKPNPEFGVDTPVPVFGYVDAFTATGPGRAYLALDRGTLIDTVDGGHHWRIARLPHSPDAELYDEGPDGVQFVNRDDGWTITFNGAVYRTTDAGRRWAVTNLG